MSDRAVVRRRKEVPFTIVDDALFEDRRLSLDARLVAGWALGKPNGWTFYISHLQRTLGIDQGRWRRIREQLQDAEYFSSTRHQLPDGRFQWENIFDDVGLDGAIRANTMRGKSMLGKPTNGGSTDGGSIDGEQGDIAVLPDQQEGKQKYVKQENHTHIARASGLVKLEDTSADFIRFWSVYPKKKALPEAWAVWQQLEPTPELVATILAAVHLARDSEDWLEKGGRFVPVADRYLIDRKWEQAVGRRSLKIATVHPVAPSLTTAAAPTNVAGLNYARRL